MMQLENKVGENMLGYLELIGMELKKNSILKILIIFCVTTIVLGVVYAVIVPNEGAGDWRAYANQMKAEYSEAISTIGKENLENYQKEMIDTFQQELDVIDFSLKNDISYHKQSAWTYLYSAKPILSFLIIIGIIIAGSFVTKEMESGMLEKIVCTQHSRPQLMLIKILANILFNAMVLLLSCMELFIIGFVFFGNVEQISVVDYLNGNVYSVYTLTEILKYVIIIGGFSIYYTVFTICMQTIFLENKFVTFGSALLFIFNGVLVKIGSQCGWFQVLPFSYLQIEYYNMIEWKSCILAWLCLLLYMIFYYLIACVVFKKKNIVL